MQKVQITEEKLLQLIELHQNSKYKYDQAIKKLAEVSDVRNQLVEPFAPTIAEFNKYLADKEKLDTNSSLYQKDVKDSEEVLKNSTGELMKALPPNKWLKVGKYYIGKRTDDWPGSPGDLLIRTEKPSQELRHQIVN